MSANQNLYSRRPPSENGEAPGANAGTHIHYGYAVPDTLNSTVPGFDESDAPRLGADDVPSVPDAIRTGRREPPENDPNNRQYNARRFADFHHRHSVEHTTTSWNVRQSRVPPGQNPLWEQDRPPTRSSAIRSPHGYLFTRPWHIPRNVKDAVGEHAIDHISMADHRRSYEIFGMRTHDRMGANTFRFDPQPWDRDLFTPTATATPEPNQRGGVATGNRSYRFG